MKDTVRRGCGGDENGNWRGVAEVLRNENGEEKKRAGD
jgi:hypothetical protein